MSTPSANGNRASAPLLEGKVVIVTGSGQGLGFAYAQDLVRQGARVVVNDVRQDVLDAAVHQLRDEGGEVAGILATVGSTEAATTLVDGAVASFGRLDAVVCNAGVVRDRSVLKMTDEDFDSVVRVHLRGTFTLGREAYRHFKENNVPGRIIAIGSPAGQYGNFGQSNYSAAKAGIVAMIRTWSLEMKRAGVTANAVIPVASTAMTETVPYFSPATEAYRRGEPLPSFFRQRLGFGTPADAAGVISFLVSDAAEAITGQAIGIGGDRLELFSHPQPVVTAYRDGGWDAAHIVRMFDTITAGNLQTSGVDFPPLPEELLAETGQ